MPEEKKNLSAFDTTFFEVYIGAKPERSGARAQCAIQSTTE